MPLTRKGAEILAAMQSEYGGKRGKSVFYASANKGTIKGVHKAPHAEHRRSKRTAPRGRSTTRNVLGVA